MVVTFESFNQQIVDGEPDRTAPVGVSAEEGAPRFAGLVGHFVRLAGDVEAIGIFLEVA